MRIAAASRADSGVSHQRLKVRMVRVGGPGAVSAAPFTTSAMSGAPAAATAKAATITHQPRARPGGQLNRTSSPPIQAAQSQTGMKWLRASGHGQIAPTSPSAVASAAATARKAPNSPASQRADFTPSPRRS